MTYYQQFGLREDASPTQIRQAYRTLARRYHPDLHGNDPYYVKMLQNINHIYEILSDPQRRATYDDELRTQREAAFSGTPHVAPTKQQAKSFTTWPWVVGIWVIYRIFSCSNTPSYTPNHNTETYPAYNPSTTQTILPTANQDSMVFSEILKTEMLKKKMDSTNY